MSKMKTPKIKNACKMDEDMCLGYVRMHECNILWSNEWNNCKLWSNEGKSYIHAVYTWGGGGAILLLIELLKTKCSWQSRAKLGLQARISSVSSMKQIVNTPSYDAWM